MKKIQCIYVFQGIQVLAFVILLNEEVPAVSCKTSCFQT